MFLEAAASGVPQVAGMSGGTSDAVLDERTGLVVDRPGDVVAATTVLCGGCSITPTSGRLRDRMSRAGRRRAVEELDPDRLAGQLAEALKNAS